MKTSPFVILFETFFKVVLLLTITSIVSCKLNDNEISGSLGPSTPSTVTLSPDSTSTNVSEGDSLNLNLAISSSLETDLVVTWTIYDENNVEASSYFSPSNGTVTISSGSLSNTLSLTATDNDIQTNSVNFTIVYQTNNAEVEIANSNISIAFVDNDVVKATQLMLASEITSYVDLVVDWQNKLAYASSREAGICVDVIDFSNEANIQLVKRLGTGTTPATTGNTCLGVALFGNNRYLAIASESPGIVEVWDLGADPTLLNFSQVQTLAQTNARTIAGISEISPTNFDIYLTTRSAARKLNLDLTGPTLTQTNSWTGSTTYNDGVMIDENLVAMAGWVNADPVEVVETAGWTLDASFNMDNGGSSGFWSAATTSDYSLVFMGGWVAGFFSYTTVPSPQLTLIDRYDPTTVQRDAKFVETGGNTFLYASGGAYLDVWDATNPAAIALTYRTTIPASTGAGDHYALQVNAATDTIAVITNKGYFKLIDITKMQPATNQPPTF